MQWPIELPKSIELFAIELPGRETRISEPLETRLLPLVQAIAPVMLPFLDKPFAFFGHSIGALIAFELTRLLKREHGLEPFYLFVSGHRSPHIPPTDPLIFDLPSSEFIAELQRRYPTTRQMFEHPELVRMILPILRADLKSTELTSTLPEIL